MPKKIRVYELAKELGLTNKEGLDLALSLGIGVKSHSSSIEDAQADRVRRKADAEGLRRPVQPEEPTPSKKAGTRAASAPGSRDGGADVPAVAGQGDVPSPVADRAVAASTSATAGAPATRAPARQLAAPPATATPTGASGAAPRPSRLVSSRPTSPPTPPPSHAASAPTRAASAPSRPASAPPVPPAVAAKPSVAHPPVAQAPDVAAPERPRGRAGPRSARRASRSLRPPGNRPSARADAPSRLRPAWEDGGPPRRRARGPEARTHHAPVGGPPEVVERGPVVPRAVGTEDGRPAEASAAGQGRARPGRSSPWWTWWHARTAPPAASRPTAPSQSRGARADAAHDLPTLDGPGARGRGHHRAGLDRTRPRPQAQSERRGHRAIPPPAGRDGHGDPVPDRRHDRALRRRDRGRRAPGRPGRGAGGGAAGPVFRGRGRGGRGRSAAAAAGRHRHGPRGPRQDTAARPHPLHGRGGGGGRRHHPAHRRLPGRVAGPPDHVHRHAGPRRLHGDAGPRRAR